MKRFCRGCDIAANVEHTNLLERIIARYARGSTANLYFFVILSDIRPVDVFQRWTIIVPGPSIASPIEHFLIFFAFSYMRSSP